MKNWLRPFFVIFLIFTAFFASASSDPLDTWHWRNPLPTGSPLSAVTYGNNGFVAVANSTLGPVIVTSADGTNWTQNNAALNDIFYAATSGNGLYVAVGYNIQTGVEAFLVSSNTLDWTEINPEPSDFHLFFGVAFGNNTFVAVGSGGSVLVSSNATDWTPQTSGTSDDFSAVTFGDGVFAAVNPTGEIFTSTNGTSWQLQFSDSAKSFAAITWSGGQFVTVGADGVILTSTNGLSWAAQNSGTNASLAGIVGDNNHFVAVGYNAILTSSDGTNWAAQGSDDSLLGVAWGGGTYVAVGTTPDFVASVLSSPDGAAWTARNSGTTTALRGVTYDNGLFIAVGRGGTVLVSPDTLTWSSASSGSGSDLYSVAHNANGLIVAVGESGTVLTSSDGIHWASQNSGSSVNLQSVLYANGLFVAMSPAVSSTILTSPDATNWTVRLSNSGNFDYLKGVAYGNGFFVAVGGSSYSIIARSSDGLNWTESIGPWAAGLGSVAFGNGLFVAPVSDGVLTSSSGTNWTHYTLGFNPGLVTYDRFFSAVNGGTVSTSANGTNWVLHPAFSTTTFDIAYGAGRDVVIGDVGAIFASDPLNPQLGIGPLTHLTLTGTVGLNYEIDVSSDLVNWAPLTNFTLDANPGSFSDPSTNFNRRFYRAKVQ